MYCWAPCWLDPTMCKQLCDNPTESRIEFQGRSRRLLEHPTTTQTCGKDQQKRYPASHHESAMNQTKLLEPELVDQFEGTDYSIAAVIKHQPNNFMSPGPKSFPTSCWPPGLRPSRCLRGWRKGICCWCRRWLGSRRSIWFHTKLQSLHSDPSGGRWYPISVIEHMHKFPKYCQVHWSNHSRIHFRNWWLARCSQLA